MYTLPSDVAVDGGEGVGEQDASKVERKPRWKFAPAVALDTLAGLSARAGFTPTRHDSGELFPCMQLMRLSLSAIPELGSYRIASCAKRVVCCQAPNPSPVVTRRLLHNTPHSRPSPQRRALLCKRTQLYGTKSEPLPSSQTSQKHYSTMAEQNEKPVFFFDIDNCVRICYHIKLTSLTVP